MYVACSKAGGAHLTREKYRRTSLRVFEVLEENNVSIEHISQFGGRHFKMFVVSRKNAQVGVGTLMNELSCIRGMLRQFEKKRAMLKQPDLTNRALGVGRRNRDGTGHPLTKQQLAWAFARAQRLGREGFASALLLQVRLGLRRTEVVCAHDAQLRRWIQQLLDGDLIEIERGTKNGRRRDTRVVDRELALEAVRAALAIAERQGGHLIVRNNGASMRLREAVNAYKNWMNRSAIRTHAGRYAYAVNRIRQYQQLGYSLKDAAALTGVDLGHGDGRGQYIRQVYCRRMPPEETVAR
jgi:hypothetical protein